MPAWHIIGDPNDKGKGGLDRAMSQIGNVRISLRCAEAFNYPHFPRFFSIFSRFLPDFWPCSLDSWRSDGENGFKNG